MTKLIALLVLLASPAYADEARCLIQVSGTTYLDEPCVVESSDGLTTLGVSDTLPSKYFAYLSDDGSSWNGPAADSHAHTPLGALRRDGKCWINDTTKICAFSDGALDIGMGQ